MFSLLSLFAGYLSLNQIYKNSYINAVYLIMASVVLDGFDGTIARLTKTDSNFGSQLDSLIDAIAFGATASMLAYKWGFSGEYVHFGKIIGFVFLSAGVIRLARFNVMKEADAIPSNIFTGLPIPAGALSIGSVILVFREPIKTEIGVYMFSAFVIIISFLMISNVKFRTMKIVQSKNGLQILFFIATILAFMIIYPSKSVPILVVLYLMSPIYFSIMGKLKSSKKRSRKKTEDHGN